MNRRGFAVGMVAVLAIAADATAHPVPFSYVDLRLEGSTARVTVVAHVFDVAHEIAVDPPERLLDPREAGRAANAIARLMSPRMWVIADGQRRASTWSAPTVIADRQSLQFTASFEVDHPGVLAIHALLFPYDSNHQTFLNIYENGTLTSQAILDAHHPLFEYYPGTTEGTAAVVRKFLPAGIHHILIGPDHLLFLVGLLLLGGSIRRLALMVSAFTVAHSVTLTLATLNVVRPSPRIVEPAIALSIVFVGVDNLLVHGGRDLRTWIAFAFGFVHGFGFASVLQEMGLPSAALGWSLFSFNLGVEIGQLAVVVVVASALAILRARSELFSQRLAVAGSVAVAVAGTFWFVQRVFLG